MAQYEAADRIGGRSPHSGLAVPIHSHQLGQAWGVVVSVVYVLATAPYVRRVFRQRIGSAAALRALTSTPAVWFVFVPTLSASLCACVGTRSGSPANLTLPSKRTWLSPPSTHTLVFARKTNNLYSSSCVSSVQNARVRPTYLSLSPAISPMLRYVTCESGDPAPGSRSRSRRVEPDKRNRGTPNLLSLSEPSDFGRDHSSRLLQGGRGRRD